MVNEIWIPIQHECGRYEISNLGRVKSLLGKTHPRKPPIILKPWLNNKGYYTVILSGNNKLSYLVHRLIAYAFIPNPCNYTEINHKNGNRADNRIENLEWCTHKQNIQHCRSVLNKRIDGQYNYKAKFGYKEISEIIILVYINNATINEVSLKYKCAETTILNICAGRTYAKTVNEILKMHDIEKRPPIYKTKNQNATGTVFGTRRTRKIKSIC